MTAGPEAYVLDTSAVLTLWNEEDGAPLVERLLLDASERRSVFISFMTVMECRYRIWKDQGRDAAEEITRSLRLLPAIRVDLDDDLLMTAAELKAQFRISVADSWIIATAITRNATLVHKDPEFDALGSRVTLKALPYKNRR